MNKITWNTFISNAPWQATEDSHEPWPIPPDEGESDREEREK